MSDTSIIRQLIYDLDGAIDHIEYALDQEVKKKNITPFPDYLRGYRDALRSIHKSIGHRIRENEQEKN